MDKPDDQTLLDQAQAALKAHLERLSSLMLATLDADGLPHASYAPFIRDGDGAFCVFVSDLSEHTANLKRSPHASILLIEDEQDAREAFAKRRLTLSVEAELVPRDHAGWAALADAFQQRFGAVIEVLRGLGDFHLIRLKPQRGSFVIGFGRAFELTGERLDQLEHVDQAAVKRRSGD